MKTFYHGTSTAFEIEDYISPVNKSVNTKTLYKRKSAKIYVTDDLEAALFYANRAVEQKGGEPIIYEVEPDSFTMVKISKTDYATVNAKVIRVVDSSEVKDL